MKSAVDLVPRLHEHRRWANWRAALASQPLSGDQFRQPLPIGQGSVLGTLTHLYAAEFIWLTALEGDPEPPAPSDIRFDTLASLETA